MRGFPFRDLAQRHSAFNRLTAAAKSEDWHAWEGVESSTITYEKLLLFIGQTGYGKSSTVNAIVGADVLQTSAVDACTRHAQSIDFQVSRSHWLSFTDMPGIGESLARDKAYLRTYQELLRYASVIVYVTRADKRDFAVDEAATRSLFATADVARKVVYALGQCDKMEPLSRSSTTVPSRAQRRSIDEKVAQIAARFEPENAVVPYSAVTGWNLHRLVDAMVRVAVRR
jgi:predicted GTPase